MPYQQLSQFGATMDHLTRWAILLGIPLALVAVGFTLCLLLKRR